MSVKVEWKGDQFERAFFVAIGKEVQKSAEIFQRNLSTALRSAGKGSKRPPVHSPKGSKIPYTITGTLARSWSVQKTKRKGDKFVSKIGTGVKYAIYLLTRTAKPKKDGTMGKSGRRNFLDARLGWRRKTLKMILARLDSRRLVAAAVRSLK
jgi:hypothetical protein